MLKIFVVEDEPFIRKGIIMYIQRGDPEFVVVGEEGDGKSAYSQILQTRPDVLLTDIRMPYMGGLELAEEAKKHLPDLKVIIISGYDDFTYASKAIHIGVVDYLLKPILEDALLAAIRKAKEEIAKERKDIKREREMDEASAGFFGDAGVSLALKQVDIKNWAKDSVELFLKKGLEDEAEKFVDRYLECVGSDNMKSLIFRQYMVIDMQLQAVRFLDSLGAGEYTGDVICAEQELAGYVKTLESSRDYMVSMLAGCLAVRDELSENPYTAMVEKAKEYVGTHYGVEISLGLAAEYVGVSASHFSRIFSQEAGVTFIEYLTQVRVERAKELLRCTNKKIAEIAQEIGYRDTRYFYTLFKKNVGCTPREYRKKENQDV